MAPACEEYVTDGTLDPKHYDESKTDIERFNSYFDFNPSSNWYNGQSGEFMELMMNSLGASYKSHDTKYPYQAVHVDLIPVPVNSGKINMEMLLKHPTEKTYKFEPNIFSNWSVRLFSLITSINPVLIVAPQNISEIGSNNFELRKSETSIYGYPFISAIKTNEGSSLKFDYGNSGSKWDLLTLIPHNLQFPLSNDEKTLIQNQLPLVFPTTLEMLPKYIENKGFSAIKEIPKDESKIKGHFDLYIPEINCLIFSSKFDKADENGLLPIREVRKPYTLIDFMPANFKKFKEDFDKAIKKADPFTASSNSFRK